ncbi:MAG: DUF2470 domain-containing protein [Myxococcota bacterium]
MGDGDVVREARWALRETAEARLERDGREATCAFVCTRDGEPILALDTPLDTKATGEATCRAAETTLRGVLVPVTDEERTRFEAVVSEPASPPLARLALSGVELADGTAVTPADWRLPEPGWLSGEQFILDHMNDDHVGEMKEMCAHFFGIDETAPRLLAVDSEGMHLGTVDGVRYLRFDARADTVREVAAQTVILTYRARGEALPDWSSND